MPVRAVVSAVIALLVVATAGFAVVRGKGGPDAAQPIVVDGERIARPGGDRAVERVWLRREAAARGLDARGDLGTLRRRVATALATSVQRDRPRAYVAAFDAFHARWRARTTCLTGSTDPYMDRCENLAPPAGGSCHWMGESLLCRVARGWTVAGPATASRRAGRGRRRARRAAALIRRTVPSVAGRVRAKARLGGYLMRFRTRRSAAAAVMAIHRAAVAAHADAARRRRAERLRAERREAERERRARAARLRAERREAAREREARAARVRAEEQERVARLRAKRREARRARMADPAVSRPTITALRPTCERYAVDVERYSFGLGLQDPAGSAAGILAARARGTRALRRAANDAIDRAKLRPLVTAMRATDRALTRFEVAAAYGESIEAAQRRYEQRARRELRVAERVGIGDCLAAPTAQR